MLVAIKVAVNHGKLKIVCAYHAPKKVIWTSRSCRHFHRSSPQRHGGTCEDRGCLERWSIWAVVWVWRFTYPLWLYRHGTPELKDALLTASAKRSKQCWIESPNLHDHAWSRDRSRTYLESHPELAPSVPLLHGHAVNIDMALTATIAENRGYINKTAIAS